MKRVKAIFIFTLCFVSLAAPRTMRAVILPEFSIDEPASALDSNSQEVPSVAFNGSIYVVVWQDTTPGDSRIRYRRFNVAGQPVGSVETLPVTNASIMDIASNGGEFMLIWYDTATLTRRFFAARLDADGNFIANSVVGPSFVGDKIASNGTDYMVFSTFFGVAVARLTAAGFDPPTYINSSDIATELGIASDGANYLVVFCLQNPNGRRIVANRVSASGGLIDATPFDVWVDSGVAQLSVTFANNVYLVAWQAPHPSLFSGFDAFARRVKPDRTLLDKTPITISSTGLEALTTVGPNGDGFLAVWQRPDSANYTSEFWCERVSIEGVVGAPIRFSNRASLLSERLALNARGTNSLFAWTGFHPKTGYDAFANFIPADGAPGAIQILQPGPNIETAPSVAFSASRYLIVWQDNRNSLTNEDDIFGHFVDQYGHVAGDTIPIGRAGADQTSPVVAAAGDHYIVVWREVDGATGKGDIKGALLINDQIIKELTFCSLSGDQRAPAVASNGADFLVVWRDSRINDDIYGIHVTHNGDLIGPLNGFPICKNDSAQTAPAVASNGSNYLVVWRDTRNYETNADDIFGAIVEPSAVTVPADFPIAANPTPQRAPDVASNGRDYFVVWRDDRDKENSPSFWAGVYGTAVSATGAVANPVGFLLTPRGAAHQREPSITRIGDDYLLVWLEDSIATPEHYSPYARRIFADGSVSANVSKIADTIFDADTLAVASDSANGALMVSHTGELVPRVKGVSICLADCPIFISVNTAADTHTLIWNAEPNQSYRVEYKNNLSDASWQLLQQATASAEGFLQAADSSLNVMRFYRIVHP
jgi:hypothetical protein